MSPLAILVGFAELSATTIPLSYMVTTTETEFLLSRFWTDREPVTLAPFADWAGVTAKFDRAIVDADA